MLANRARPIARRPLRHAIVAGGSIAGLLAARVLSDHFERVTLIERDPAGDEPQARAGVPQGNHLHAVLVRGLSIIESFFPGLTQEVCRHGGVLLDAGSDLRWYHSGGWRLASDSDLRFLSMSRPLLESRIAARLRAIPNVTFRGQTRVQSLLIEDGAVSGLRVRGTGRDGTETVLPADLVVDAMGRGSPVMRWLDDAGLATIPTELIPARVSYASCMFERSRGWQEHGAQLVTGAPAYRSGCVFPIEGDRWLMTLIGFFDEPMPQDREQFMAYARSLPVGSLFETVRHSRPVSEIVSYRFVGSLRRYYERVRSLPGGLISMGDSVCSFNPVYGQGMTVSAIEAETLASILSGAESGEFGSDFVRDWYRRIRPVVDGAWKGVSIEDFRFPETAQLRPVSIRPVQWYMGRVHKATHRSAEVTAQFYRVVNFLASPGTLFRPAIMKEVLFGGLKAARHCPLTGERRSIGASLALAAASARQGLSGRR
jgi:2-polyprenyl-6-methoxyphenol hydroxylase-like FAD-dependent oxidoreductase